MSKTINLKNYVLFVTILFTILFLFKVSISHVGYWNSEATISSESIIFGEPREIRADEFMRGTPNLFGNNKYWSEEKRSIPFTFILPDNNFSVSEINPIGFIVRFLPNDYKLSFNFIFYSWALLIFLPLLFRKLEIGWPFGVYLGLLIQFSPSNLWWSNIIVICCAQFAFSFLLIVQLLKTFISNVNIFTFPFLFLNISLIYIFLNQGLRTYQLFSIPILISFVFLSVPFLFKLYLRVIKTSYIYSVLLIVSLFPVAYFLFDTYYSFFLDISSTNYPGARRSLGGSLGPGDAKHPVFSGFISYLFFHLQCADCTDAARAARIIGRAIAPTVGAHGVGLWRLASALASRESPH